MAGAHAFASYWLGWRDADPPQRTRVVVAQVQAPPADKPLDKLTTEELKAELIVKGLSADGKLAELRERVERARDNLEEVRAQEAPKLDRRELPERSSPREHLSSPSAAPTVRPVRSRGRERGVCAGSSAGPLPRIVKSLFGLRSPYKLVDEQRQKRRPPPKRQLKWTAACLGTAAAVIARGEQPGPLRCSARPEAASRDGVGDSLMAEASESDDGDGEWACD